MTATASSAPVVPPPAGPFPGWPVFDPSQVEAVRAVLASGKVNYWTGTVVREFEREYAAHLGVRHAVAVFNGTIALELILRALDIGPGDEVVVPPRTFVATASCVLWSGARPVFADVERESGNLSASTIRAVLTPRTKAVIVVHLAGWPCDMGPIMALARERGIKVIEDCAQAHAAEYQGRKVGNLGDVAAFSFCQDKIITTGGEGGLIALNDDGLWERIWSLKDHGKSFEAVHRRQHPPGFRWLHEAVGTNGRMLEMQAAIGRDALRQLPTWVARRAANAEAYADVLRDVPGLRIPRVPADSRHAYYRFYVHLDLSRLREGWNRDRIMATVAAAGYPVFSGSCCEIYLERVFEGIRPAARLPVAAELSGNSLCFLTHPTLEPAHCREIAGRVRDVILLASR